jgi:hypothetical protein
MAGRFIRALVLALLQDASNKIPRRSGGYVTAADSVNWRKASSSVISRASNTSRPSLRGVGERSKNRQWLMAF